MYRTDGYKSLIVWQKSYQFTIDIYKVSNKFPREEIYGLVSQIRRATSSIPINIAEGYTRNHKKEFIQFLIIAKGSCAEVETILLLSKDLHYIPESDYQILENQRVEVSKLLQGLINKLKSAS